MNTPDMFKDDCRASSCTVGAVVVPPNPKDVVYTPPDCAKMIVDRFNPTGRILEPCRGRGAFTDLMPGCEWCEIEQGRDFFAWTEPVDWIVSNPPYSVFDAWLDHSFRLADNVVYLIPFDKIFKSMGTINKVFEYGGIRTAIVMPARWAGFPFGFPCGAFHFARGWKGPMQIEFAGGRHNESIKRGE